MEGDRFVKTGCWDSIHVVEATENDSKTSATYKLTTTVMLHMGVDKVELGDTLLSGSLTRQVRSAAHSCPICIRIIFSCFYLLSSAAMYSSHLLLRLCL